MKKLFVTITLLLAFIGSAFAEDSIEYHPLIKYASYEVDKGKILYTYVDIDAREPYNKEEVSIDYFLFLQSKCDNVKLDYVVTPENIPGVCMEVSKKHEIYHTVRIMETCASEYFVCYDGTVIRYMYTIRNE